MNQTDSEILYEKYKEKIKEYYLQDNLLKYYQLFGQDREVVPVIKAKHYAKRPSMLLYDTDYKLHILEGATSFHTSVERWKNVMKLKEIGEDKDKMNEIRSGWDIIIDIDSKRGINDAKIVAKTIIDFLRDIFEIHPIYIKFSGSRGFHIGISGASLPQKIDDVPIQYLYPDLLHKISIYIKEKLLNTFKALLNSNNPQDIVEIESNWSYRHLFRMPYSINEKTYLISEVIPCDELMDFEPENARIRFLDKLQPFLEKPSKGDLEGLCYEAIEYYENSEYKKMLKNKVIENLEKRKKGFFYDINLDEILQEINTAKEELIREYGSKRFNIRVEEEFFPQTIKNILKGLSDGRKRGIFILLNFLRKMNWTWDEIEKKIEEWNNKNQQPLRESYIRTQIRYFKKNEEKIKHIPPPNFETQGYYDDMGVLDREDLKLGVKNPITYAYKKKMLYLKTKKKQKRRGKYENINNRNARNR